MISRSTSSQLNLSLGRDRMGYPVMAGGKPKHKAELPLAEQPEWARKHTDLWRVEPIVSLTVVEHQRFMAALSTFSREDDLSEKHQILLYTARGNIVHREKERASERTAAQNGGR